MKSTNKQDPGIIDFIKEPIFLSLIIIGGVIIFLCFVSVSFISLQPENKTILLGIGVTLGTTICTLGITLPVALYFQTKNSNDNFKIIKACERAGIKNIFVSRKKDHTALFQSIEDAAEKTSSNIFLLGVAFKTLFNPNVSHTPYIKQVLRNPKINLRVMLLDKDSPAAKRRAEIETGSSTIPDIDGTLKYGLITIFQTRIYNYICEQGRLKNEVISCSNADRAKLDEIAGKIQNGINIGIKVYSYDPISLIMGFDHSLFSEQYHFGSAPGRVEPNSCIAMHIPVLEYNKESEGYSFLKAHFDYMWDQATALSGEKVTDLTKKIIRESLATFDEKKFEQNGFTI